jgi:hypothetical protein
MSLDRKTELIERILDIELQMFLTVPVAQKAACQDHPDSFILMRRCHFLTWSGSTLTSYLGDLIAAKKHGRNLMTEKYARIDHLIPQVNRSPLIEQIVRAQYQWQQRMFEKYPNLMARARPLSSSDDSIHQTSFETYLRGELETYSERTLRSLYADVVEKQHKGHNMTEELYQHMVRDLGYESLAEADEQCADRSVHPI